MTAENRPGDTNARAAKVKRANGLLNAAVEAAEAQTCSSNAPPDDPEGLRQVYLRRGDGRSLGDI